jgi:hypothetical protein
MPRPVLISVVLPLLLLSAGCVERDATANFDIEVTNKSASPLSAGLIKNGPPLEEGWAAPHEIAINAPHLGDRKWGTLIPPGQSTTISQTGRFGSGVSAILRAYSGDLTIDQLKAFSRDDPDFVEVYLYPGAHHYIIGPDVNGHLTATAAP